YRRLLDEGESLPQLVVIDGGKGQLSAALESLERLGLRGRVAIIGIAKRLEEIYFPQDPIPLYLDKKSESLRVVQQLRNEAHRFGIAFHRKKRSNAAINSALENIEGIGAKTAEQLLRKFKSVRRIRESSLEQLSAVVGPSKARKVYESLRE
ncbi:MAG: helix-hairpin-helix domain-containing protein, partial [Robiginitalea sp.]